MSYTSTFKFIGEPVIPKEGSKMEFIRDKMVGKNSDLPLLAIKFGVRENKSNTGFVELSDFKFPTIKTVNKDNQLIDVDWEDRNDESIIASVPFWRQCQVNLGEEYGGRKTFISQYDFIDYLRNELPNYEGKIEVTGSVEKTPSKTGGQVYTHYVIRNVYAVPDTTRNKLEVDMDIFFNKFSIDRDSFDLEKKIFVNGYVQSYVREQKKKMYFPMTFVMSAEKYDFDNEKHVKRWEYLNSYFDNLLTSKMTHIPWECRILNGAQEVEFDESQLSDRQKMQIELGISTIEDFKPKGGIYGDRIHEIRLSNPILKNEFVDGAINLKDTISEFEEMIYSPEQEETLEDILAEPKKEAEPEDADTDEEDLF